MADGTFINTLNATLDSIDKAFRPTYDGYQFTGPPRFQDFRRSDDVEDRRRQSYYQNPVADPAPPDIVGQEQGSGFDYDYLSSVIRIALGQSNPLSIAAGINDIKQ
jgi:hypothetical protein